ncbi:cysteine-rich DPF motif domain-containing protein 1 isoform X5 [Rhineura floridana]|uniref:cysteine-rich DPF motif domain-containing protein 1 isoform X5 n=1 Tax=Rhineura floridana TaxID=261503 RepID=UPI002AC80DC6|nr:cysteine-rich DPF motif domain-containing protein 1 isoform X5 [Rhineura floridana]XP_061438453.1 cysteine-rich DPF motif domain-containing protein 1 isoform X5 [Rhineura floridana]
MRAVWINCSIQLLRAKTSKCLLCCFFLVVATQLWNAIPEEPCLAPALRSYSSSLLEESYVMKDPFTSDKDKFLILGSQCSLCCKRLCVGTDCSLFYTKRFCLPCVNLHLKEFPLEIRKDLEKKSHSKSQSSKKEDSKISKKN